MPYIMLKQCPTLPPILRLPDEILEEIVSELDRHSDLLSLALTSRICAAMVIPHHTQYRILRVRNEMPDMWAHLARRSDLARNVREVHICEPDNTLAPDHYPTTLIHQQLDQNPENAEEKAKNVNVCQALSHMRRLQTFTWSWMNVPGQQRPTSHPSHENAILTALSGLPMLEHVSLHGKFAMHALNASIDFKSLTYPGWKLANLKSLSLSGDTWAKMGNSKHLCNLIAKSPDLEYLEVPEEFYHLADCRLPKLKHLKMMMQAGGSMMGLTQSRVMFLQNHPSIEVLDWSPFGMPILPYDILPKLRSLRSNKKFSTVLDNPGAFTNLQATMTPPLSPVSPTSNFIPVLASSQMTEIPVLKRNIEDLDIVNLDPQELLNLKFINRETLKRVKIHQTISDIRFLHEVAAVFPNIEWLSLPPTHLSPDDLHSIPISKEEWLDILPRFSKLQVFRGSSLWSCVKNSRAGMHNFIRDLVQVCPHLRVLDRLDKRGHIDQFKEIVITRQGEHGEIVDYGISLKPTRNLFDVMDGNFD